MSQTLGCLFRTRLGRTWASRWPDVRRLAGIKPRQACTTCGPKEGA